MCLLLYNIYGMPAVAWFHWTSSLVMEPCFVRWLPGRSTGVCHTPKGIIQDHPCVPCCVVCVRIEWHIITVFKSGSNRYNIHSCVAKKIVKVEARNHSSKLRSFSDDQSSHELATLTLVFLLLCNPLGKGNLEFSANPADSGAAACGRGPLEPDFCQSKSKLLYKLYISYIHRNI